MKMKRIILIALVVLPAVSCGKLDVVGNDSIRAFGEMLDATGDSVPFFGLGWSITAPDNSAQFLWDLRFAGILFEAKPFEDAGLIVSKLPRDMFHDGMITLGPDFGFAISNNGGDTPLAAYEQIVRHKRDLIGYHAAADHYGINLGDGNMFEWAKDMSNNDKDIVFVLNPQPFIDAGVDPDNVEGWLFAKVTVDDENGRPIEVDKLLKPFNLR
jgi:hypothetical protein